MCIQSVDLYARRNVQMGRSMSNVGIIGAGSWGCALAKLLHNNGNQVTVWSIMDDEISMLKKNHEHKDKLPGVILPGFKAGSQKNENDKQQEYACQYVFCGLVCGIFIGAVLSGGQFHQYVGGFV